MGTLFESEIVLAPKSRAEALKALALILSRQPGAPSRLSDDNPSILATTNLSSRNARL
jgi:hypothetical protein